MAFFIRNGNTFQVTPTNALDLHDRLPTGTYTVGFNRQSEQFFLERIEDFRISGKLYGRCTQHAQRIINTFLDRPASTGVMLVGEKGSGKTLLSKKIACMALELDMPTIVINQPWAGEAFNTFMQTIDQPAVVVFDEFEKVYDRDDQVKLLTLLDGVYPSKKLFMLTSNDKWNVDQHMCNRPGRIYYLINFTGLEEEFIREYCADNLQNLQHVDTICKIASVFNQFNFDMLKAMVEEMNRYNETPHQALSILNITPEFSSDSRYAVELQIQGRDMPKDHLDSEDWSGNPINETVSIAYRNYHEDGDYNWARAKFEHSMIRHVDSKSGKFLFVNEHGERLVLTRLTRKGWDYSAF